MKHIKFIAVALFCAALAFSSQSAYAAKKAKTPKENPKPTATQVVQNFYDKLVGVMKQGERLGFEGRFEKLEPAVKEAFDLPFMARMASGAAWSSATAEEQKSLSDAFSRFSVANYASRFTKYDGEKFEITGEKPSGNGGIIVRTKLTPEGEDPVALDYLVRADESGTPKITDVFLDASISELATRRSQFSSVIKRGGFSTLISELRNKTENMGAKSK